MSLRTGDREAGIRVVEKHIENQKKAVMEKLRQEELKGKMLPGRRPADLNILLNNVGTH